MISSILKAMIRVPNARCKLCECDFTVVHGVHNDAKRHCESSGPIKMLN